MNLKLAGTVWSNNPSSSMAVIEFGMDKKQSIHREGDFVGGVRIKQIQRDRIIIQSSRGEEIITLRRSHLSTDKKPVGVEHSEQISFGPTPPLSRRYDTRYLDSGTIKVAIADIEDVLKKENIEPVTVYGKPGGVKIHSIEPGSLLSEIGLKTGDTIKEVDGKAVSSPEQVIGMLRQLKAGDDVDIKVKGRRTRIIQLIQD